MVRRDHPGQGQLTRPLRELRLQGTLSVPATPKTVRVFGRSGRPFCRWICVIDRDFGGFIGPFPNGLGGIGSVLAYNVKSMRGANRGFDDDGFAVCTYVRDRAIDGVDAILANLIDFYGSFFTALCGVVSDNFGIFGETVERIFRAGRSGVGAMAASSR